MKHTVQRRLSTLSTVVLLLLVRVPAESAGQTVEGEPALEESVISGEPVSGGVELPTRRINFRDRATVESPGQRIIRLDTLPDPLAPRESSLSSTSRWSRWKWVAIGAGAASAAAAAYLSGGSAGVTVPIPAPGGTITPTPVPLLSPVLIPTPAPVPTPSDPIPEPDGNGKGKRDR